MPKPPNKGQGVTMYTVDGCPFCHRTKELLKAENVDFTEYEISEDEAKADELIELTGRALVPVTLIAGATIIGFDKPKLMDAIQTHKNS